MEDEKIKRLDAVDALAGVAAVAMHTHA